MPSAGAEGVVYDLHSKNTEERIPVFLKKIISVSNHPGKM